MVEKKTLDLKPGFGAAEQAGPVKHNSLLMVLLRRRWSIFIITVVCLGLSIAYVINATAIYTSTARICVEQSGPSIIGEYEGLMSQSKNYLYTQGEILQSTSIISDVVSRDDIKNLKTFTVVDNGFWESFKEKIGLSDKVGFSGVDGTAVLLKKILDVKVGLKDDIISVSCKSAYRDEAALIVNAVVDSYISNQSSRKKDTVSEVLSILQKAKIERDEELESNFQALLEFTRKYGVVSFESSGDNAVFERLKNIGNSLTAAQLETINSKAAFESVEQLKADYGKVKQYAMARPSVGSHLFINDMEVELRTELKSLNYDLDNLLMRGSEDLPSVKSLRKKISDVEKQLAEELAQFAESYIGLLRIEYETAKAKEEQLRVSYEDYEAQAQRLNVRATEYAILEARLEQSKKSCEVLDSRIKNLNVSEDVGALNIIPVESASPAEFASSPQRAKIVSVGLVLGLVFGFGFGTLRELMDYRLRGSDEVSAVLGVPVIGLVPSMNGSGRQSASSCGQKVHFSPKSTIAEAYRSIRTAVFFGVPKTEAKTILVTSPAAGDGKTTLVSNIGIAMAQAGQNTLIIDADFRKPMQHNIFGFDNEVDSGLSSVLSGQLSIGSAIRRCETTGLSVLTSGPDAANPSELLNSQAFSGLLQKLSGHYDRILIDSPPVTPVADSQILSAICDVTILVLRADKSTRKLGLQARDALLGVGGRLFGVVVNDISRRQSRYGSYSYYGYYGYGYGKSER